METPKRWSPNVIADGYNVIADGYKVRHLVCHRKSVPIRKKLKRAARSAGSARSNAAQKSGRSCSGCIDESFLARGSTVYGAGSRCAARTHCEIFNILNQSI